MWCGTAAIRVCHLMYPDKTKIFYAILLAAGIIGIILIYIIITIVSNQRRHLKLQHQHLVTEITTLENERRRIVSDLHDDLGSLLSIIKFQVISVQPGKPEDQELINKAVANVDDILERIRDICNQLMPQVLIRKGLITAIEEFIREIDLLTTIHIEFMYDDFILPASVEIHVFRMIQEMVNNAARHSAANVLSIKIQSINDKLILTVKDDGKGFYPDRILKESNGLGLKNMLSRTDVLKGELFLESLPGKGTTYTIEIPNAPQNTIDHSRRS